MLPILSRKIPALIAYLRGKEYSMGKESEKEKKILVYLYGSLDIGGAETMMVHTHQALHSQHCVFDYIVIQDREYQYSKIIRELGGRILPIEHKKYPLLLQRIWHRWVNLYKIMKENQYDVFHCNTDVAFRVVEIFLAKLAKIPIRIIHSHSSSITSKSFLWKIKKYMHIFCRKLLPFFATDFLSCSTPASLWMYGKNVKNVVVLQNGIDTNRFQFSEKRRESYREKMHVEDNELLLSVVGRFSPVKNQKFAIGLLKELLDKGIVSKLVLLGEGETRVDCEKLAEELGIQEKVIFTGNVWDLEGYLCASDVLLMPSLYEGLPLTGIEAQCSGLPILASDTITKELNQSGVVFYASLSSSLEEWIEKVLALKDAKLNRAEGKQRIEDAGYSIQVFSEKLIQIYSGMH